MDLSQVEDTPRQVLEKLVSTVLVGFLAVSRKGLAVISYVAVRRLDLGVSFELFTAFVALETTVVLKTLLLASVLEASVLVTSVLNTSMMLQAVVMFSVQSVVFKDQTATVLMLGLRVDQLQVLLRLALLQRVLQEMVVLFLHVYRNRVEVLEFDGLVGFGVFMFDVVMVA